MKEEHRNTIINDGQIDNQKLNRTAPIISNSVTPNIKDDFESNVEIDDALVKIRNGNGRCNEVEGRKRLEEDLDLKSRESLDDEELTLDLEEPSPEVMEYARKELGETEEVKCQTLQELREMIYGNLKFHVQSQLSSF